MLEAVTSSSEEWKSVAQAISVLIEEASFVATPEGLNLRAMDSSHIALIDLKWPSSSFEKYACDTNYTLTVRVEDLLKVLRRADSKDRVEIRLGEDNTLEFKLQNGYQKDFTIHLVETQYSQTPLPKVAFNVVSKLSTGVVKQILDDIKSISDHVSIKAEQDKLVFSGKSEVGKVSVTIDKKNPDVQELTVKETGDATYSIEYLSNFAKSMTGADILTLQFSSKMPIKMEFPLSGKGGVVQFYLAPRVD
ncbi:MAG: proliferating cell nuclear antigen (pcna) [Nitrososphaerota archaeon]|jgi:proliferating cell nuclear antigen|nr:proliferating cell nuclear antigen (pcna) [Nitrososphaerota archaeon]